MRLAYRPPTLRVVSHRIEDPNLRTGTCKAAFPCSLGTPKTSHRTVDNARTPVSKVLLLTSLLWICAIPVNTLVPGPNLFWMVVRGKDRYALFEG